MSQKQWNHFNVVGCFLALSRALLIWYSEIQGLLKLSCSPLEYSLLFAGYQQAVHSPQSPTLDNLRSGRKWGEQHCWWHCRHFFQSLWSLLYILGEITRVSLWVTLLLPEIPTFPGTLLPNLAIFASPWLGAVFGIYEKVQKQSCTVPFHINITFLL